MIKKRNKTLIETVVVCCEGTSEYVYLQELNRFFRQQRIPLSFSVKIIGTGAFRPAVAQFRKAKRENKQAEIIVWVDYDLYVENQRQQYLNKPPWVPDFLFSKMNFEDFLVLHMEQGRIRHWQKVCDNMRHFHEPMISTVYAPIYKTHCFEHYKKGRLPFRITWEILRRLFANLKRNDSPFSCDFGTYLEWRIKMLQLEEDVLANPNQSA